LPERTDFIEALNLESQPNSVHDTWDTNEANNLFMDTPSSNIDPSFSNISGSVMEHPKSSLFSFDEDLSFDMKMHEPAISITPAVAPQPMECEYEKLQNQIKELQSRMNSYENMLNSAINTGKHSIIQTISPGIKPEFLMNLNIEILDFSPEWDYVTGGSKVLICINPTLEQYRGLLLPDQLVCRFDGTDVPVNFVQGSVLRCFAPPHKATFVSISLIYSGQIIASSRSGSNTKLFEYRAVKPKKKKQHKETNFLHHQETELESREYKIRAIECLSSLELRLHENAKNNETAENMQNKSSKINVEILRKMKDEELETIFREQFGKVCVEVLQKLKEKFGSVRTANFLNSYDEHGCALIHYISVLDYYELIEPLHSFGAILDIKTQNEQLTPLVISAANGNKKTLSQLLPYTETSHEEEKTSKSCVSPLKIAVDRRHHDVLEMLLRDMTLKDAISMPTQNYTEPEEFKRKLEQETMRRGRELVVNSSRNEEFEDAMKNSRNKGNMRAGSAKPRQEMNSQELNHLVLKIQRNVREWLLRRHYKDIKQASKVLHSTIEKNVRRKSIDEKSAAIMIQRTVRTWLNLKNEIS